MEETSERQVLARRLEMATRAARIAVWEWDIRTDDLYWSPVFLEILGLTKDQFRGRLPDFSDRVVPEDRERVAQALQSHVQHGKPYDIEYEMFHASGRRVAVAARGQATHDAQGQPLLMIGTVRDITDRNRLRARLLEAERIAHIGHWVVGVSDSSVSWSPETFRIHGLDPADPQPAVHEAIGFYHPEDQPLISEALAEIMRTGIFRQMQARLRLKSGEIRHVLLNGHAALGADGTPRHVFGIIHDRTELVKKERQLERALRAEAFGQLAGGVAHDFNNLMTVMLGNLQLLESSTLSHLDAEDRELIQEAVQAIIRGRELTQSLLSLARSAPLRPEPVLPHELLTRLQTVLRRTLPASMDLVVESEHPTSQVHADPANLEACLINLVINARDAIVKLGRITLSAREVEIEAEAEAGAGEEHPGLPAGCYIVFEVRDDGHGIPAGELDRVFEPFFTTKTVGEGSGLGLSRVRGFAEQSGGAVRLDSQVGVGTRVRVFLPALRGEPQDRPVPAAVAGAQDALAILLVEDVDTVRRMIRTHLERRGHQVIEAASGAAGLRAFQEHPTVDLVISDLVMPGDLQGPDMVNRIREQRPDLPAIFMSGYARKFAQNVYGVGHPETLLMKPVTLDELDGAIRAAVDTSTP